jgi:DNA/RNA-binding domain of Phe-tRNA-synthetase-like protein
MVFRHSPAIWSQFPALVPGLLVVDGIRPGVGVREQIAPLFARARARLAHGTESDLPEVQAWRRAFAQMGLKPTQYRSAAEALLRRFRKEDDLPTLHPLVDLCNAVSLAFALPIAVFDLDHVVGSLEVRHAQGDEIYEAFGGAVEHPEPGEVIFADVDRNVHARRWTFRQSRRSTASDATRRALIVSEGLHTGADGDIATLLDTLAQALDGIGFGCSRPTILSAASPSATVPAEAE